MINIEAIIFPDNSDYGELIKYKDEDIKWMIEWGEILDYLDSKWNEQIKLKNSEQADKYKRIQDFLWEYKDLKFEQIDKKYK